MKDHANLLMKEISVAEISLVTSSRRSGVTAEELENISRKLRLKKETLAIVERFIDHGIWIPLGASRPYRCSKCGYIAESNTNFCPDCGKAMDPGGSW